MFGDKSRSERQKARETAQQKLEQARKKRDALYSQMRRASQKAQKEQTAKSQKAYMSSLRKLEKQREVVSSLSQDVKRKSRLFQSPEIVIDNPLRTSGISEYKQKQIAREQLTKIQRRMSSLRKVLRDYFGVSSTDELPENVPYSDALREYERAIMRNGKSVDLDSLSDRQRVFFFYNKLETGQFEQATPKDYKSLLEGYDSFVDELGLGDDYQIGEDTQKDTFYQTLNMVRMWFPLIYKYNEGSNISVHNYIKRHARNGESAAEIFRSIQTWVNSQSYQREQLENKERKARREQAKANTKRFMEEHKKFTQRTQADRLRDKRKKK
ncbi:MAG: hypothetical protein J6Y60_05350 [Treponema sp.]|nr:hypothetical protein [Treponema sp.]